MNLKLFGEHTIDVDKLTGGAVLDAGCLNFHLMRVAASFGCKPVVGIDPSPDIEVPADLESFGKFWNAALVPDARVGSERMVKRLKMTIDRQGRHLSDSSDDGKYVDVVCTDINELSRLWLKPGEIWDVVKLDIEGGEMAVLEAWPGPITRQLTVEFHEHCWPQPPARYEAIFEKLSQWYDVVQHEKEPRHCGHPNWFDTLLVLKEGI